jgi:hypothetical protein
MAEPTLVAYAGAINATGTARTTASFTWQSGDVFHILGITDDNGHLLALPSTAGSNMGTVSEIFASEAASTSKGYYWRATATGAGSGTFGSTITNSGDAGGIAVWQYRATDGQGTPATQVGVTAKTTDVARGQSNSHVISVQGDWAQVGDVVTDPTPATNATERQTEAFSGKCDVFVQDWGDQGGTGTTAYGITNHTGTVTMTQIAVEIFGSAGGGGATIVNREAARRGIVRGVLRGV